jgi:hypothetical protein
MIKLIYILKEIGDANSQSYEYSYDGSNYRAYFTTEYDTQYKVIFKTTNNRMEISFGVIYNSDDDPDYEVITNKGNIYRIMGTIIDIINRAISEFNPNEIKFDSDNRRIKLYKNYMEKNLKGYSITKETPFNLLFQRNNPIL